MLASTDIFNFKPTTVSGPFKVRVVADGGSVESESCLNAQAKVLSDSGILRECSLFITPNGCKTGKLYAQTPSNGNGDLTWTRNSGATRVNSAGLIENVLANVPRLDYSQGSCPSILLEPQRTNLATYSQEFNIIAWTKTTGTSVNVNTSISPSGIQNADTIVGATGPAIFGGINTLLRSAASFSPSTSYVFTIYLKGSGSVTLTCRDGGTGFTNNVVFNLTSSWQRFEISRTTAIASTALAYIFSNASGNFDIWGAQLEQGAYPTSYIPTVASTVTRVADSFNRNNIFTNGLISASGGTWFVELDNNLSLVRDAYSSIGISDTSTQLNNSLVLFNPFVNSRLRINKYINGTLTQLFQTTTDKVKIAITWNGTTANVFVNGVKVVTNTAFTTTNMEFLSSQNQDVPKYIKQMWLENVPMSDTKLIAATTL